MTYPRDDQFTGCLVGQCIGDALGFVVEGYPPEVCRRYVEETLKPGRFGKYGRGLFPLGQYTDDSQLARELLQSYVSCRGFDPRDYARRIAAIFREGRIVGRGRATTAAAMRLADGVPWEEAGEPSPAAGNGSAMRAGPVGLMFFDDHERLIEAARDQGRITHRDPRCSAGSVAIAGAVALAATNHEIDATSFLATLAGLVRTIEPSVSADINRLTSWITLPPGEAVRFISIVGLDPDHSDGWQGMSPFVTSSVLWSLYSFLRTPGDYWQTVCTAIEVGGDVDTTGAMAGAISGAHLGLGAIPATLARRLTDRGSWGFAELVELAGAAFELKKIQLGA